MKPTPINVSTRPPYLTIWFIVFGGAALLAVAVQLVVLPRLFPAFDGGSGLIIGTNSLDYHRDALAMAARIRAEGWGAWIPGPQFMTDLLAVLYALTVGAPWVAIPLAAAAHALAAVLLVRMMLLFTADWRLATLAAAPFVLFPSAMFWYTQLLKDGYFLVGLLLFADGWMRASMPETWRADPWRPLAAIVTILVGFGLMGMVRFYMLSLMRLDSFLLVVVAIALLAAHWRRGELSGRSFAVAAAVLISVATSLGGVNQVIFATGVATKADVEVEVRAEAAQVSWKGKPDSFLPRWIENRLQTLSGVRRGYLSSYSPKDAHSMIDTEDRLESPEEMLRYIPRALQIGFLAPFPDTWLREGTNQATTIMRRVTIIEMIVTYGALICLPWALWRWRRNSALWVLITFSTSMILVFSIGTPNVGTLYRIRYGFLMPVVGLGVLAAVTLLRERRTRTMAALRSAPALW